MTTADQIAVTMMLMVRDLAAAVEQIQAGQGRIIARLNVVGEIVADPRLEQRVARLEQDQLAKSKVYNLGINEGMRRMKTGEADIS